jgi:hypothetical protein
MKRKFLPVISLAVVMALAACGAKPTPGLNLADVQNTAIALAGTALAMTQTAMPTNTPVPPMPTVEVATPAALPTIGLPTSAVQNPVLGPINNPNATATPDCYQPRPAKLLGTTVQIKLVNKSDGPVNLSMGMYEPNDKGECYTFAFSVGHKGSQVVTLLSGCYWGAGYQNGPKPSTPRVNYICFTDTAQTRGLTITNNSMGFD